MAAWGWDDSKQLGGGGFGKVYEAHGPAQGPLAAKVVPKAEGATREHLIAQDTPESPHVVPILHVLEESDSFVLFMPRADYSLRHQMGIGISAGEAIKILSDLAEALSIIAPIVVHRDIKPDNVLFWNGHWALCDFGIARYADAATGEDTRKFSLSAAYAAPEQWRAEHATSAADIYAFGVMAYELLSGERPFSGSREQLRTHHLNSVPPVLPGNRKLSWIISECLQKAPEARPTAANLMIRLRRAGEDAATRGGTALAAAQSAILAARAAEQAHHQAERTEQERRKRLADSARVGHSALVEELVEAIADGAPVVTVERHAGGIVLSLGEARLRISKVSDCPKVSSNFDVVAYSEVRLEGSGKSRSHSLYFANFDDENAYSWYELGFMSSMNADFNNDPRSSAPPQGLTAIDNVFGGIQLAWGINPLDISDLDSFIDYWAARLGQAALGQFPRLHQLPEGQTRKPLRQR